ncbi:MAG: hypothetical protein FWG07_03150 [Treponema sp.]|nr:hypothetical protein [Treponema sp.]
MKFTGVLRKFDCSNNKQFNDIGEFWDFMSKIIDKNKLKGLGFNWENNYFDYIIGDLKEEIDFSMDLILNTYPDSKIVTVDLPDNGWKIYKGKIKEIKNIYEKIYRDGPLDYEIEEIDAKGNFKVSIIRLKEKPVIIKKATKSAHNRDVKTSHTTGTLCAICSSWVEQVAFLLSDSSSPNVVVSPSAQTPPQATTNPPVTTSPTATPITFLEIAPSYDRSGASVGDATLTGIQYRNALVLTTTSGGYSLHNLNRRYARFKGSIGRVDGTNSRDSTISFHGDGRLLRTFNLKANDLPTDFDLEVEGIRQLSIEFGGSGSQYSYNTRYALINTVLLP